MSGNDKPAFGNADGHPSDGHIDDDGAPDTCSSPEPENSDRNSFDAVTEDDDIPWPECRRDVLLRVAECRRDLLLTVEDVSKAARNVLYMMSMFDLQYVDKPLRNAIDPSLKRFQDLYKSGQATVPGLVMAVLETFMENSEHLRRHFTDPAGWPRPSHVVEAEIDARMPWSLELLRDELEQALLEEEEAKADKPAD